MFDIVINAKNNPKIKEVKALLTSSKDRKNSGLFVVEGVRLCCDALLSGCEIQSVFCTENCAEKYEQEIASLKDNCNAFYTVSNDVLKAISDTVTPQGVVCTVKMKQNIFEYEKGKKYVALDTIQNPDNLGAISRTAEALGLDGMVICGGCDIRNPKALRASMGALFRLPIRICQNLEDEIEKCKKMGINTFATVPDREATSVVSVDFSTGGMCVIGNEGNGVSKEVIEKCNERITIKMDGRAESLNASAAASIIMWEMAR
ncbi:MAG: RNA methyltransferase [Clostridia bacterium]|nr:RNA methyltransferase [Clostridia bacterium]